MSYQHTKAAVGAGVYADEVRLSCVALQDDLDDWELRADLLDLVHQPDDFAGLILSDSEPAIEARAAIFALMDSEIDSLAADNAVRDAAPVLFWPVNSTEGQLA
ncbi:hypothetical protein [Mycolicibacterium peregrinum]|uniref:hypothetical protein n=1 Tax=Mycolicibacterium peregrinum TaxID=43304 RepID=UPI0010555904|nr:hypothetical protein [Mycolicibacterium peregrinum]